MPLTILSIRHSVLVFKKIMEMFIFLGLACPPYFLLKEIASSNNLCIIIPCPKTCMDGNPCWTPSDLCSDTSQLQVHEDEVNIITPIVPMDDWVLLPVFMCNEY